MLLAHGVQLELRNGSGCHVVGFDEYHLLADDKQAPNFSEVDVAFVGCTDDVMHWTRTIPLACDCLARLDVQWGRSGSARKLDKDIDWSLKGTAIGCDFDGGQGFLDAHSRKQIQTTNDTISVLTRGEASPTEVMQVVGSLK